MTAMPKPTALADLTDALGQVRQQIRDLKDQEAWLREALIAQRPNGPVRGEAYQMFIRHGTRRTLIKSALPPDVLRDPGLWQTCPTQTVVTRPVDAPGGRRIVYSRSHLDDVIDTYS